MIPVHGPRHLFSRRGSSIVGGEFGDAVGLFILLVVGLGLTLTPPAPLSLLLLLLAFFVALISPPAMMAAIAASVPFVFQPVAIRASEFSLLELGLVIGSVGLAGHWLLFTRPLHIRAFLADVIGSWQWSVIAFALVGLGCFSLFTVADPSHRTESLRELRVVIIEPLAALVLMRWVIRRGRTRIVLIGLLASGLAVAMTAIGQVISGRGEVIGDGVGRATGPYPHPNNLALYLDRVGLFAAALAFVAPKTRRIVGPVAVIVAIGLAATLSRGAVLAVIVGGAAVIGIVRPPRAWRWFAAVAVGLVALFALVAGDRLFASGTGGDVSSRELIWRSSIDMIRDHPIFGVGLDQFLYQYAPRYVSPAGWPERYTSHPHNLVLDVWLRLGIAGLVLFAIAVAYLARLIWRLRSSGSVAPKRVLGVAAAVMLIGGATHGLVDNGFFLPDLAVLTWVGIAFVESACSRRPDLVLADSQ